MTIDMMDEHERSEYVRSWLRQNTMVMLGGVGLGVAVLAGIHFWQEHQQSRREQAQMLYRQLEQANEKSDTKLGTQLAARLRGDFKGTPYAVFADLHDARRAQEAGDLKRAGSILADASRAAKLPELKDLSNLRLARVKLADGNAGEALALADSVEGEGFKPLAAEIRGDALVALKREVDAAKAYDSALTLLDSTAAQRTVVELKRNDLSVAASASPTPVSAPEAMRMPMAPPTPMPEPPPNEAPATNSAPGETG